MELRVVLVSPRNPLNIGAAARALGNFGFAHLRVVNPYEVAFREAVSAVGGASVLQSAEVYSNVADAVADCALVVGTTAGTRRELAVPTMRLEAGTERIKAAPGTVALLFGSEKFGLSNDDISYCHWLMRIPTGDGVPSMNLGQAVAVCLYELIRDDSGIRDMAIGPRGMDGADAEQLTRMLLQVLEESGYTNRIIATSTERKIRRFVRRAGLVAHDAPLLLGILRQILWKFRE